MEQRLIDANKLLEKNFSTGYEYGEINVVGTTHIEDAPTIDPVHAAGACYCRECIKRNTPDCAMWYQCSICGGQWSWESDNVFCSFGKRRE